MPEGAQDVAAETAYAETAADMRPEPIPIATSGELKMMPPSTGLPTAREVGVVGESYGADDPFGGGLLESIPAEEHEQASVALAAEGESSGR